MIINIIGLSKFFYLATVLLLPDLVVALLIRLFGPFCGAHSLRPSPTTLVFVALRRVGWALQILF